MSRFRAVTFDVTGTLLRFRLSPPEYYTEVGSLFGVKLNSNIVAKNFKTEWLRMNAEHPNFGLHTGMGWERWWREIVRQTFINSSDCVHPDTILDSIASYLIDSFQTTDCWATYMGAIELLEHLSEMKIPLGIISNNDERLEKVLQVMQIRKYFKFILTSYSAGFQKPDPKIFQLALDLFEVQDLQPSDVLHVGDKVELDYFGSERAGWNGALVHVERKAMLDQHHQLCSERVFNNLLELKNMFEE